MFENDSLKPDFNITWKDADTNRTGKSTIYTYGSGRLVAIAALRFLRPTVEILKVERLA